MMACTIFVFLSWQNKQEKRYYTEKNNNLGILKMEARKVGKAELEHMNLYFEMI